MHVSHVWYDLVKLLYYWQREQMERRLEWKETECCRSSCVPLQQWPQPKTHVDLSGLRARSHLTADSINTMISSSIHRHLLMQAAHVGIRSCIKICRHNWVHSVRRCLLLRVVCISNIIICYKCYSLLMQQLAAFAFNPETAQLGDHVAFAHWGDRCHQIQKQLLVWAQLSTRLTAICCWRKPYTVLCAVWSGCKGFEHGEKCGSCSLDLHWSWLCLAILIKTMCLQFVLQMQWETNPAWKVCMVCSMNLEQIEGDRRCAAIQNWLIVWQYTFGWS